jgi:hypothetical protein
MFDKINVALDSSWTASCANGIDSLKNKGGIVNHGSAVIVAAATPFAALGDATRHAGKAIVCTPFALLKTTCGLVGLDSKFPAGLKLKTIALHVVKALAFAATAVIATVSIPFAVLAPRLVSKECDLFGARSSFEPTPQPLDMTVENIASATEKITSVTNKITSAAEEKKSTSIKANASSIAQAVTLERVGIAAGATFVAAGLATVGYVMMNLGDTAALNTSSLNHTFI